MLGAISLLLVAVGFEYVNNKTTSPRVSFPPSAPTVKGQEATYHHLDLAMRRVKQALIDAYQYFQTRSGSPYRLPEALCDINFSVEWMQRASYRAALTRDQYIQLAHYIGEGKWLSRQAEYCLSLLNGTPKTSIILAVNQLIISARCYAFGLNKLVMEIQQSQVEKEALYAQ